MSRAAAKFVILAERFGASVDVIRDGQRVPARSIMGLMMFGAGMGSDLELRAEGWDAKEACDALAALVESGFDEQGYPPPPQHKSLRRQRPSMAGRKLISPESRSRLASLSVRCSVPRSQAADPPDKDPPPNRR